jgi:FtsP/CotA-like multicopper oxidase with cupredoxin domain
MLTRRRFMAASATAGLGVFLVSRSGLVRFVRAAEPGEVLDGGDIDQFVAPLLIPPVMPRAGTKRITGGKNADYYEISMRQFAQQILPPGMPATTVWGYGAVAAASKRGLRIHNAPSLTIEASWNRPVTVKWINELVDAAGNHLPHLLPVDPTLHWANPGGGAGGRDTRPFFETTPGPYTGPVPIVTHVHGAVGVGDESDGYAEAWYLPAAKDIPEGYAETGTWYDFFAAKAFATYGTAWGRGYATSTYPNLNRASTIWYHDHAIGMTRLNVYAGPAGFYIVRGGPDDTVIDTRSGAAAVLPGPAPREGDRFPSNKTYYEIPIAIQDRTFRADGSLFYPDSRTLFDGVAGPYLPGVGEEGMGFSPIWNPEFFGNTMMVNGTTWPFLDVEQRRYRLRLLNGCDSRFLVLDFTEIPGIEVWQIGNEGGFLPAPVNLTATNGNRLLLGLAERADVIVDFTNVPAGRHVLRNVGPDEPYGGGVPDIDFPAADPATTGRVMEFRVGPALAADATTPPRFLGLPPIAATPPATLTRSLALIEEMGMGVDADGNEVEGPVAAKLGTMYAGMPLGSMWEDAVTENPAVGATETWEFYNTTGDAHPMHVHEVVFEVVNREGLLETVNPESGLATYLPDGNPMPPESWEAGFKDTVTAYPGQVTRVKATFGKAGQYVWHCHIVSHEDNEMMRPFRIGPPQPGQPRP